MRHNDKDKEEKNAGRFRTMCRLLHARAAAAWRGSAAQDVLALRRGERWLALAVFVAVAALNGLLIYKYFGRLTQGGALGFYSIFTKTFHVSGFDASSCIALSCEDIYFNSLRHPLFFSLLWPFYWLNSWAMEATGINYAVFIMAAVQTVCAVWSSVFMYRTLTECVGLGRGEALPLVMLLFSFAYIMLSVMVPDHFGLSLTLLLLTVWLAGRHMRRGTAFGAWGQAVLLFLTAGVTLTNGAKSCLAFLFVSPRKVWGWRSVLSVVMPLALLCGIQWYQHEVYEMPMKERVARMIEIKKHKDPHFGAGDAKIVAFRAKQNGTAIDKDNLLLQWSDISTPRWPSIVHNLFGESLILHRDHLLEDVQNERPVFVPYSQWICYVAEALLVLLLAVGVWRARRERLMLMLLSWLAFDALMHIGFGFAINEVYIMTAHWAFAIPLAAAYVVRSLGGRVRRAFVWAVSCLAVWLLCYNGVLIVEYCLK